MRSIKKPIVSIIIRTKNEEKYIKHCLEKIKQQNFKNPQANLKNKLYAFSEQFFNFSIYERFFKTI